jgi:hypothetical protein
MAESRAPCWKRCLRRVAGAALSPRGLFVMYVVLVLVFVQIKRCLRPAKVGRTEPANAIGTGNAVINWNEIQKDLSVSAKPDGLWTWAYDYVQGPAHIMFVAKGKWSYAADAECGADGDPGSLISASQCLVPEAPVGALVVKVGGSTAGTKDGKVFVVGSRGVVDLDSATAGPILLAINDEAGGMGDNSGEMKVTISVARADKPANTSPPPPSPPAQAPPPASGAPAASGATGGASGTPSASASTSPTAGKPPGPPPASAPPPTPSNPTNP